MADVGVDLQRRRDLGRILDDSFRLYRAHLGTLLLAAAVVVVPVQLVVFGLGLGWLASGYDATPPLEASIAGAAAQLLVVTPLVTAMTVHVVLHASRGERPAAGATVSAGLEAFSVLFLPIVMVLLGVSLGLLALVIPGIYLAIRWAVVAQAVVVDGARGGDALQRSMQLTSKQGWFTFIVLLVTNLLVGILALVLTLPLDVAAREADAQALSLLGQTLGQLVSLPIVTLAVTLLYFSLRAVKEGEAPQAQAAQAAGPEVPAASPVPPAPEPPDREDDPFGRRRDEGWEPPVRDY